MHVRPATLAGGMLLGGVLVVSGAAPALAVCDAYSGSCVEPTKVLPTTLEAPATDVRSRAVVDTGASPSTLPFTGGELVLVSALGAAAVAGGTALVVAGRRRNA